MGKVRDESVMAQRILERDFFNFGGKFYHSNSAIYKVSNEMISAQPYQEALADKNRILSVIASGDQILNSILLGSTEIDGYDISVFPKYFLLLKMAAVLSLTREEFISFFLDTPNYRDIFSYEFYEKIRDNLSSEALEFWDSLFDYYDGYDIYSSTLFSSELYTKASQLSMNPYLDEDNYKILRSKIGDINIRFYEGNIFKIADSLKDGYDLINLSSIIYYMKDACENGELRGYIDFLSRLPLNDNGIAITYLYDVFGRSKNLSDDVLARDGISLDSFQFLDKARSDGVLTYQKRK